MDPLQILNDKIDQLLKRYTAVQAENTRLKETIAGQIQSMDGLNTKLASLEEQLSAAQAKQTGNAVMDNEERNALRKQLDHVITEIDKMLTTIGNE
jgi:predicted  nucleic acid-binding Zn-ribbon protein